MDSSNSPNLVSLVLGNFEVDLEKMSPWEQAQLLKAAIKYCEPLKYFPGFKPYEDFLNWRTDEVLRLSGIDGIEDHRIKLLRLFKISGREILERSRGQHKYIEREWLMVNETEKFLLWKEGFSKGPNSFSNVGPQPVCENVQATSLKWLDHEELLKLLSPRGLLCCLRELSQAAKDEVKRRTKHLQHTEGVASRLAQIADRVRLGPEPDGIPI